MCVCAQPMYTACKHGCCFCYAYIIIVARYVRPLHTVANNKTIYKVFAMQHSFYTGCGHDRARHNHNKTLANPPSAPPAVEITPPHSAPISGGHKRWRRMVCQPVFVCVSWCEIEQINYICIVCHCSARLIITKRMPLYLYTSRNMSQRVYLGVWGLTGEI